MTRRGGARRTPRAADLLAMARLARWLGPWAAQEDRPRGIRRRALRIEGPRPFDAWVYRPRGAPRGALLLLPGLHYLGPADPRLDRFLAVLADAGLLVLSPFLPEFRQLRVGPSLVPDATRAFDALLELPERPAGEPSVMSISFGSYPAIALAADPCRSPRIRRLVLFGGYASFEDTVRFSLEGDPDLPHDPLNRPVVFLNLLEHLEGLPRDAEALRRAWTTYVRCTWGRPPMKERRRWEPLARAMAARLPQDARELFLLGTGVGSGASERVAAALSRGRQRLQHLDPLPACAAVRGPVTIIHGRDDDVIPYSHAAQLAGAMPPEAEPRVLITGLYGHTGAGAIDPFAAADELRTLARILGALL